MRENDNDRQWKLLLPIMPTLHGTHQTILSDCLVLNNYLTIKNRKNWQTQAFVIISKVMFDARWLVLLIKIIKYLESLLGLYILTILW